MVSVIPAERSGFDVIGQQLGQSFQNNLGPALQRQNERQMNMDALDRAQAEIAQANGDPYKISLAFARAGANNPNLQRSLGPLMQTALANAQVQRAYGGGGQGQPNQMPGGAPNPQPGQNPPAMGMQAANAAMLGGQEQPSAALEPQAQPSTYATPGPFNIMTVPDMDAEAKRYAAAVQTPNGYATRMAELQNQNEQANAQRGMLEDFALKANVPQSDLAKFMNVGSKFDTRNPTQWVERTKREFEKVQSADKSLQRAFIPGIGNAILGTNREQALKNLEPEVKRKKEAGLEQETRNMLADNYVTPAEIEGLLRPLTSQKVKAIEKFPEGDFPPDVAETEWERLMEVTGGRNKERPVMSYEEMLEKNPKKLQEQQSGLAEFFLNNVDEETSLLPIRHKLWKEKNYDWRQIGPAIHQAEQMGLKLNPRQQTEMAEIDTQAPYQSLPEIFQSMDRFWKYLRGNK